MIFKRLRKEPIAFGPWKLGRWGLPINVFAAAYTLITLIFSFFPPSVPVTAVTMNWSCVVYGGVVIFGIIFYLTHGHKRYVGPSTEIGVAR
jgi:choline transport protein